jgi:alpha-beta hydrolase superfamily lysophospholipase
MGHSMGGALLQWYLKYMGDDLPAVVLVAPWTSQSMVLSIMGHFRLDFVGTILSVLTLSATPTIRNPQRAARMFIMEGAVYSPEDLYSRLGPESLLILLQYLPPFWLPPKNIQTPMLWLAAQADTMITEKRQCRSAEYYDAEYVVIENVGHDIMIERNYHQTAKIVHEWLRVQGIV